MKFARMSQFLQYFAYVGHNSAALDAFAEVMKVTVHTELRDAKLAWYSPRGTIWQL